MSRNLPPVLSSRALPATVTDLLAQCVVNVQPQLLDDIVKVYIDLFDNPDFRELRGVDDPEKTKEGSIQDDDTLAALMVRQRGTEMGLRLIKAATLHDIRLKLRTAERRYNASRTQRDKAVVSKAPEVVTAE